jgi:hypothetical protein
MINYPVKSTDLRLSLPEVVEMEIEYFDRAREISDRETGEAQQWQTYLNVLALQSLEEWLNRRLRDCTVEPNEINTDCYLKVGEFKLCVIATEHVLDEIVNIPESAIKIPEKQAHFYILLEVLEEQQQAILRGIVHREELVNYCTLNQTQSPKGCYQLPLALFDNEPNHLLFYFQFTEATALPLHIASTEEKKLVNIKQNRTKLNRWLQDVFKKNWLSLELTY